MDVATGNFYWWVGVVEDRNDPRELGRVRVRILGLHSEDLTDIPTSELPWAQVLMPVTSASLAGIGQSATGIVQGSWVIGYFLDGKNMQNPCVMGTIPSIPYVAQSGMAFKDPDGVNPVRSGEDEIDTPDSARSATYTRHASYQVKDRDRVVDIEKAIYEGEERETWNSPGVHRNKKPKYPYNKVHETESGHVFEIDDTPGAERISEFHKSGTTYEIQDNGDKTITVTGDKYSVTFGSENIYVQGDVSMTIDGDFKQLVKGNYHLEVDGDKLEYIKGNRKSTIALNEEITINGEQVNFIAKDKSTAVQGNISLAVKGNVDNTISGSLTDQISGTHDETASVTNINNNTNVKGVLTVDKNIIGKASANITAAISYAAGTGTFASGGAASIPGTMTATGEVTGNGIALSTHTHTDTGGLGAGTTSPPN